MVTISADRAVRDFRGLNPKSFDGPRQLTRSASRSIFVFPEINYDRAEQIWGMDVIIATTARSDEEARELLRLFDFPFRQ